MVTIKIIGCPDVKLTSIEFNTLVMSLKNMVSWDVGGMFGDGGEITDKAGMARAKRIIKKLNYD